MTPEKYVSRLKSDPDYRLEHGRAGLRVWFRYLGMVGGLTTPSARDAVLVSHLKWLRHDHEWKLRVAIDELLKAMLEVSIMKERLL